jgi:glycosyltransferase 2 family protein
VRPRLPRSRWGRFLLTLPFLIGAIALLVWRAPDWGLVVDAFTLVSWRWVIAAIALNLLSVIARALAWRTVIDQALPPPQLPFRRVFSAFGVGLFANAVLPGRIGELARVAVLTRRLKRKRDAGATLVGTVFAHRVFDLFPSLLLIGYVLVSAKIPHWALTSLAVFVGVSVLLFAFAVGSARRGHRTVMEEVGQARRLITMARYGLGVMRAPLPAAVAVFFQTLGWAFQLFAVWAVMRAFGIYEPLHAAALVLLLMNIATLLPLWPGNIGIVQAAVALPLVSYGVAYSRGFAFGIGLQVIEVSVGVGVGLLFLAREGLSFATLRRMPGADEAEDEMADEAAHAEEPVRARAGLSG